MQLLVFYPKNVVAMMRFMKWNIWKTRFVKLLCFSLSIFKNIHFTHGFCRALYAPLKCTYPVAHVDI